MNKHADLTYGQEYDKIETLFRITE